MDFGDGVPRHPAPLYEAGFLLLLAAWLGSRSYAEGARFRAFLLAYKWRAPLPSRFASQSRE